MCEGKKDGVSSRREAERSGVEWEEKGAVVSTVTCNRGGVCAGRQWSSVKCNGEDEGESF